MTIYAIFYCVAALCFHAPVGAHVENGRVTETFSTRAACESSIADASRPDNGRYLCLGRHVDQWQ